ncbi:RtcB family protein [Spirosoma utsteinense]|uniref:3'-phosphate/5'-hydroxy nucleic acid ligase n=1 Tax=Spirosoma utsteinense TaxID=2585773 RepID=A0ABR6W8I4_9BACT|nr:RtcB family protein [Spirosoma utsteinense]MBC3787209.1 tRNA-splicing ligase RtcB [Spirosoma utsteinense]MBC3792894.1 tRNA-splicing ligase RtcB [Spirosoma utsteinense]
MDTLISIDDILALAPIPEPLQAAFLRVANGLVQRGKQPKGKVMGLLAQLLQNPKKYAFSKNKVTNLAKAIYDLNKQGIAVPLSEAGAAYLPAEPVPDVAGSMEKQAVQTIGLREGPLPYAVFGREFIEEGALKQMETAASLPISVAGALMPDAHQGYGLPIGGVLATEADRVIPFAVGVDIACRMCLSVFDLPPAFLTREPHLLKKSLVELTKFGMGGETRDKFDESVMDLPEWQATKVIRDLKDKAYRQLGSSGTGNHFVEWGIVEVHEDSQPNGSGLNLPPGDYLALLSHSGSRGFGANIANTYSKLAMQKTKLPGEAAHLAWLDLNTQEGQEYWIGMNLAGAYASANHHEIHHKLAKALREKPLVMVENHHNFAWKEQLADGRDVLVHRKGATPAGPGVLGIIPGSMTQPGFVVRGRGNIESLNSASHGAGRLMSRTKAFNTITRSQWTKALEEAGVLLVGGDLDEAPMVYKDIDTVIGVQLDLVDVLAKFTPKIVRMADANRKEGRED